MSKLLIILAIIFALWFWRYKNRQRNPFIIEAPPEMDEVDAAPLQIPSSSGQGSYTVDTGKLTCTCPDFKKRRFQFNTQDPRRLCKHLLANIDEFSLFDMETANEIFHVGTNKGFPIQDRYTKDIDGTPVIVHIPPNRDRPWVNVYIEQERYGYNVEDHRWAHGQDPMESEALESWMGRMYRLPTELSDRII